MNNQSEQKQSVKAEDLLKKVKFTSEDDLIDPSHEQKLRRALLNSRYCEQNFLKRYLDWVKNSTLTYWIPEVVLIFGIILMIISGIYVNNLLMPPKNVLPSQGNWWQNLENDSRLEFSHIQADGTRVYTLNLNNSSGTIEFYDESMLANIILISK